MILFYPFDAAKFKVCLINLVMATSVIVSSCAVPVRPAPTPSPEVVVPDAGPVDKTHTIPKGPDPEYSEPTPDIAVEPPIAVPSPWVKHPPEEIGYVQPADWDELPGWKTDNMADAWPAFIRSCLGLKSQSQWQAPCWAASRMTSHDNSSLKIFFETWFKPYRVFNSDGSIDGMVTGYYEPLLHGSRTRTAKYRYPAYGVPDDLLTIEVSELFPELAGQRVRGRRQNGHIVPYFTRGEIDKGIDALHGRELAWIDDPVELFFLHIQGSGRVKLDNGEYLRLGYADHNGHPYQSIGRILIDRGELTISNASMQGIKKWARANPDRLDALLAENPAYVFFRELPSGTGGPIGALGVPITPGRSIAVDERSVPLGAPVFLTTTWPNSSKPLSRLMFAQDKGGAIKGAVRADFFWGFGDEAAKLAGRMRQSGQMWVLLPTAVQASTDLQK